MIFDHSRSRHRVEEPSGLAVDARDQSFHVQERQRWLGLEKVGNKKPRPSVAGFGIGDDESVVRIRRQIIPRYIQLQDVLDPMGQLVNSRHPDLRLCATPWWL